ncbi:inositol monophosphatase [Candidatus Woesearchaeota archaeon]|nr:MAG: inositol monophosphatase [Candidatus Woesearchaeota archaeon]
MQDTLKRKNKMHSAGFSKELRAAKEAAVEAGRILMRHFRRGFAYRKKSPTDFVSEIDLKAEKKIISILSSFGYSVFSEEAGMTDNGSEYVWYVDPLDGTHNYIHGIDPFAVSIGLTRANQSLLGVIFIPRTNELYYAVKGKGAWLNGKRVSVSSRGTDEAMVSWSSRFRVKPELKLPLLRDFSTTFEMIRFHGSSAQNFAWLASGNIDAMLTFNLPPHDMAAGFIIMKEAGARITDFAGNKTHFKGKQFLITNRKVHQEALKIVSKHRKKLDSLVSREV